MTQGADHSRVLRWSGGWVHTTTGRPDEAALAAANLTGGSIMANPVREVTAPLADQAASGRLTADVA